MINKLSVGAIVGTAVALGVVHVLSGADHLSAVATLSANVAPKQAFFLGFRWGLGHSIGLLLIGTIFIAITATDGSDTIEIPHGVEKFFESLVGVFMLLLGAYGIRRAWKKRFGKVSLLVDECNAEPEASEADPHNRQSLPLVPEFPTSSAVNLPQGTDDEMKLEDTSDGNDPPAVVVDESQQLKSDKGTVNENEPSLEVSTSLPNNTVVTTPNSVMPDGNAHLEAEPAQLEEEEEHVLLTDSTSTQSNCCSCCFGLRARVSAGSIALLMGIVHGLAGPGGVLGVIPAVQLHDWRLALLYLGVFCVTSTFIMGVFATVYGALSSKMGGSAARREFWIEFLSACLSVAVGIIWLVLIPLDKLDDIFG